ncbi:PREDICTED: olfactory receptor 10A3-like [Thamnophis sirtalis]|uniref:Olfactory receptor n=1 Tax=Thamnophis sirtalis TaxID=35019 RepID=A0A6I9XAV0_9SAUR|nr:PREDICTED: olfactory receptor 10A3-like [Thamnophis sirtalis]
MTNDTTISEFVLLGFGEFSKPQVLLFSLFLVIYILSMVGNFIIIILVVINQHFHTPMYIFLANLAFMEACCSSAVIPKMLSVLLTGDNHILFQSCFIQFYIYACLEGTECYLLAMMSYDRYLAICKPLDYATLMSWKLSFILAAVSWAAGLMVSTTLTLNILWLSFCGPNKIEHYFCDAIFNIREISCSDTYLVELSSFIFTYIFTLPPLFLVFTSYTSIIVTILRTSSITGRQKAFSTCSSHLIVVGLYYGTFMLLYLLPRTKKVTHVKKFFSLFHTALTPMINPLIYSLRNNEVKDALNSWHKRFISYMSLHNAKFWK